jgi:putative ABC transport system permease protein
VAASLFPGLDPVGRELRVGDLRLEVIGVAAPRGIDPLGTDLDDFVTIPFGTATRRLMNIPYVHAIHVQAYASADLPRLEQEVREILLGRHGPRSGQPEPFRIQNQASLLRAERAASAALNDLIPAVSFMALLLGGVGILTVMLMSVRERTREIGLRRAVGASRKAIRHQFLMESALLGMLGGTAGVVLGVAAAQSAALLGGWDVMISWPAAGLGFVSSVLLGLLAGAVPAIRAARLEPMAALRTQ